MTEKAAKIVISHHPYEASREDEISFEKGEVIKVTDDSDPDWWIGKKKDGALGFFPRNFVNMRDEEAVEEEETAPLEEPRKDKEDEEEKEEEEQVTEQDETEEAPEEKKDQVIGMARVMEDYASQGPGEISLPRGGIINVYELIDSEWARGELNGKVGKYPIKHVEDIDMPGRPDFGRQVSGSSDAPKSPTTEEEAPGPKGGFKLAAFGVKQGGIGSLFAGGGFPGLKKAGGKPEEKKEPAPVVTEKPIVSGVPNVPAFTASSTSPPVQEKKLTKAIVLHPYDAENEDELSLLRGEYVEILDRHGDEGWWKGRNERGEEGVFPSNFVKELEDEPVAPPTPVRARRSINSMAKPPQVSRPSSVQTPSTTAPVTLNQRPFSVQTPSTQRVAVPPKPFTLPSSPSIQEEEPVRAEEKAVSAEQEEEEAEVFEEANEIPVEKVVPVEETKPAIEETKSVVEETKPVVEETKPVVEETKVEPVVERDLVVPGPKVEKVVEPVVEKEVAPIVEDDVEPVEKEALVEKEVEPVVEKDVEPIVESKDDKEVEPVLEKETQKDVEPVVEKEVEPVVEKEVKPIAENEPIVEKEVEPIVEKEVEPVVKKEVEPVVQKEVEPIVEKEVEPIVEKEDPAAAQEKVDPEEEKKEVEESVELDSMASTGPKLTAPSRVRLGGRARRSPQTASNEPSQMEILQKEVESAPEEEKKKEEERKPVSPPAKPMKPIFAKFPTPFAVGSPEELQKPKLKPTTRRLWEEKPATEEKTEEEPVVRPSGVKNIASRFNFNTPSSSGNEVLETKLKNHTKSEVEKVRKEFEQLLQEEREKREALEKIVKALLERVQALEN